VPPYRLGAWARRKLGPIAVWRARADGSAGCGLPCVVCRRTIVRELGGDYPIEVVMPDGRVFRGPISDAPPSKPSSAQRRAWG